LRGAVPNGEKNSSGRGAPREPRLWRGEVGGELVPRRSCGSAPALLVLPRQLEGRGKTAVGWARGGGRQRRRVVRSGEEELDPMRLMPDPAVANSIRCGGDGGGSGAVVAAMDPAVGDPPPPQARSLPFLRYRYSLLSEKRSERRGNGRGSRGRGGAGRSSGAVEA
jgi:hypothetical protein